MRANQVQTLAQTAAAANLRANFDDVRSALHSWPRLDPLQLKKVRKPRRKES